MHIDHKLQDFYSNASQVFLSILWKDGQQVQHIWYLRPHADFELIDGDMVRIYINEDDIHGGTIATIEVVESNLEEAES